MMDTNVFESYRKSGKIANEIREWSKDLIKPDAKILDIAEKIEAKIKENNGGLAFPVNVCINDVTAHYTPKYNDETLIKESDSFFLSVNV